MSTPTDAQFAWKLRRRILVWICYGFGMDLGLFLGSSFTPSRTGNEDYLADVVLIKNHVTYRYHRCSVLIRIITCSIHIAILNCNNSLPARIPTYPSVLLSKNSQQQHHNASPRPSYVFYMTHLVFL